MPQSQMDLLFGLMFLAIFLILLKYYKRLIKIDNKACHTIIVGIGLLFLMSAFKFAGNFDFVSQIPFLASSQNRQLAEAVLIVLGLLVLLTGVGRLLPAFYYRQKPGANIHRRYFGLKMIGQAINRARNIDAVFEIVLTHLNAYLNSKQGIAYKYSAGHDMLLKCGSIGFTDEVPKGAAKIRLTGTALKIVLKRFQAIKDAHYMCDIKDPVRPDTIIPIGHQGRLFGAISCWFDDSASIDADLPDFLTSLGDLVGKHLAVKVAEARTKYFKEQEAAHFQLMEICSSVGAVGDVMVDLFRLIKELIGAEYVSLAVLDNSGENMVRYTVGSGGRMLFEKGVSRCTRGSYINKIYREGKTLITSEINIKDESGLEDGLFISCGMKSRMACPVTYGSRVLAVLTLGHFHTGYFRNIHGRRITNLMEVLATAIQREQLAREIESKEEQMLRLQLMGRELSGDKPLQEIFDDACEILTKRMKSTIARVSLLDRERKNLVSQSCRTIRKINHELQDNSVIPLSLLPWHRMILEQQKLMLINQTDQQSRMQIQESSQALLPGINSAILVPITLDNTVRGIISIGEVRNWNRRPFGASDLIFAKDVAAKCSIALKMKKLHLDREKSKAQSRNRMANGEDQLGNIKGQLNTPLSSIIGSTELLKQQKGSDESTLCYYEKILKAADRVKDIIDRELTSEINLEEREAAGVAE